MMLKKWLFESNLVYGFIEFFIGVALLIFTVQLYLLWKRKQNSILKGFVLYYIFLTVATFLESSRKFVWGLYTEGMDTSYVLLIIDEGSLGRTFLLLANVAFMNYINKTFSQKRQIIKVLMHSYSLTLIIFYYFPYFHTIYLKILVLIQSLLVFVPAMVKAYYFVHHTSNYSKKKMLNVFRFCLVQNLIWITNVFDGLWDLVFDLNFGPFYYTMCILTLTAVYFAYEGNFKIDLESIPTINTDNILYPSKKIKGNQKEPTISKNGGKEYILLSCPFCFESSYYRISSELHERCISTKGQLTSVFIRSGIICTHPFIVYIDQHLDIRGYERLDYSRDIDLLLKNLPDAVFHVSYDTTVIDIFGNEEVLFQPREHQIGKKIINLIPKDVGFKTKACIEQAIDQKKITSITYSLEIKGEKHYFEARCIPTSQNTVLSVIRDVTELKKAEKKILVEQLRFEKIESLAVLAGGIAHDFNNLLVSILGNVDLLQYEDNLSHEGKEILSDLTNAGQRAKQLTQKLLTFSKRNPTIKTKNSLIQILDDSISLAMRGSKSKTDVKIIGEIPEIELDSGQINQLFDNLLLNAQQAMPQGGIITITIELKEVFLQDETPLSQGTYIQISFEDQGKGIPKEQQKHIFEPYFTTKTKGNGLGLASCYSIMQEHDGWITFESEANQGTVFKLYFPIQNPQ
ncbi:Adaptive-response sensory-kinase SasA [Candidatus Lokiarchaeum ossiferum]|uniref:Adaptive-response sensory-kinase SasA n=1 Tax=Candidatus Lokiarchaeum ossiferum TaxID=2951803 RepID=A0ABY6HUE8_9ARCH|nr:Adaptive-response sensory-kinase SasA [Candidatus Lokiarchaeum sp. B-35]